MASWKKIGCRYRAGVGIAVWCAALPLHAATAAGGAKMSVAPNQSVSIADVVPVSSTSNSPSRTKRAAPASHEADAQAASHTPSDTAEPATARPSMMIRPRRSVRGNALADPPGGLTVPWYRSGLVSLAVVLGLVGAVYWLTRKLVPSFRASDSSVVRVVARSSISPRHNVALLRVGRRFVLVGVSGDRMSALSEITDADEVAELVAKVGGGAGTSGSAFERVISRETDAFAVGAGERVDSDPADDAPGTVVPSRRVGFHGNALSQLKDRLRGLQKKQ